ncbi:Protein FAR1-RELATED SEQUENCE 7 [Linum grandiflorum]
MRADYKVFGDSISFDTTYRTNEHYRPLAMFVGYNHNRRVCLFGAALLYDEMTKTFKWLFKTFKTCMEGRVPKTIFTDQAAAITAGIRLPAPDTFHAVCTFHINQNAKKNLGSLYTIK